MSNLSIDKNKAAAGVVIIALVCFGLGFLTSNLIKSKTPANGFNPAAMGGGAGGFGQRGTGQVGNRTARMGGFINGTLLKKDATSLTIKMRDGSSKIVLVTSSTKALKMADTTLDEFTEGADVMVSGTANPDGSVTAQTVQVRPAMPTDIQPGGQPQPQPVK
ncbi:MAG: hypothetical protein WC551_02260 [Patescibacteria group bacterium]